jgi:hypothetical protein
MTVLVREKTTKKGTSMAYRHLAYKSLEQMQTRKLRKWLR